MILVIAEKPSVAQSIAKVLGVTSRKDGYMEGGNYIVSWCFGHLVELADARDVYKRQVQDQVWNRVTINRAQHKATRYYMDEFHLLLKEEQTAAYSVEIWKRFRKWGGIPTGITQNVKDLLASREVENIFENSDFVYLLNQASGDRQILSKALNICPSINSSGLYFGNSPVSVGYRLVSNKGSTLLSGS